MYYGSNYLNFQTNFNFDLFYLNFILRMLNWFKMKTLSLLKNRFFPILSALLFLSHHVQSWNTASGKIGSNLMIYEQKSLLNG